MELNTNSLHTKGMSPNLTGKLLFIFFRSLNYCLHFLGLHCIPILYAVLHIVHNVSIKVKNFFDNFPTWQDLYLTNEETNSLINSKGRTFKKIPEHLIVILGTEKPSYSDLAKIIIWCLPAGIKCLSLYDHKEDLIPINIYEAVKKKNETCLNSIKWGHMFSHEVKMLSGQTNGFTGWELQVNLYGWRDGKQRLVDVTRRLHEDCVLPASLKDVSCAMDRLIEAPPPDLAVVCGPALCLYGCLPWHMRLTHFVKLGSHQNIKVQRFLRMLHQYSNSEQRYGK